MSGESSQVDNPVGVEEPGRCKKYRREIDFVDYLKRKKNEQHNIREIDFGSYLRKRNRRQTLSNVKQEPGTKK